MGPVLELAADIATRPQFDSFEADPYHDPVGYPTVGYGHLLSHDKWPDLSNWESVTEDEAKKILMRDMETAFRAVMRLITVDLPPERLAALVDFAFNCGGGNLQASTLRRVINRGDFEEAPEQFMRWTFARGVKLAGLVRRRAAEVEMWESA